jgi:predicted TPR repeat methyltransferase
VLVALGALRESAGDPAQAYTNYSRALAADPGQAAAATRMAALQPAAPPQIAVQPIVATAPPSAAGPPVTAAR